LSVENPLRRAQRVFFLLRSPDGLAGQKSFYKICTVFARSLKKQRFTSHPEFQIQLQQKSMDNNLIQYMVDFTLPAELPEEFVSKIPQQRNMVNRLLSEGKILNYALSLENSKLWVVFAAPSETELMEMVHRLPLTRFMDVKVNELTFYNTFNTFVPAFSVN
jgi:muconolactone delta-isomerase